MDIQKYFFAFVYDMISVSDFEKWVYENADIIETKVNADILSELLECDYNSYIDLAHIRTVLRQAFGDCFENYAGGFECEDKILQNMILRYENENIPRGTVTIDITGVSDPRELQRRLRTAFKFPKWYGLNWDAFYDIADLSEIERIKLVGFENLYQAIPEEAHKLLYALDANKSDNCDVVII
ncbi:barstar family protein [Huintestinicola sp.]|uniref:barstar family protein n=1 Tax=Huintestinicola sp. TaxID=2981661 RepID=UPI003D7D196A